MSEHPTEVLAICGSLRAGSSNAAVLRALAAAAPEGVSVTFNPPLDGLPFFNADIEEAGPPAAVAEWRARIAAHDALAISSPEYAHGVSGVLKNALDWLVGGVEIVGKPIAILNPRPQATWAQPALIETLRIMGGVVVDQTALPLTGRKLDWRGIAADPELAGQLRSALDALVAAASEGLAKGHQ